MRLSPDAGAMPIPCHDAMICQDEDSYFGRPFAGNEGKCGVSHIADIALLCLRFKRKEIVFISLVSWVQERTLTADSTHQMWDWNHVVPSWRSSCKI